MALNPFSTYSEMPRVFLDHKLTNENNEKLIFLLSMLTFSTTRPERATAGLQFLRFLQHFLVETLFYATEVV